MTGKITVNDLHVMLVRLEGKVDASADRTDTFIKQMAEQDRRSTDLEVRTRKVENRQHWWAGAAAVIGAMIGRLLPGAH